MNHPVDKQKDRKADKNKPDKDFDADRDHETVT